MQGMVDNLNAQVDALNAGRGPLGNLLTDSSLYESLHGSTARLHNMLKELREDPRKFLRVKVF
jgi:phospholipid/cholesterol/gamma-HCH transport system substrate-binding protein